MVISDCYTLQGYSPVSINVQRREGHLHVYSDAHFQNERRDKYNNVDKYSIF